MERRKYVPGATIDALISGAYVQSRSFGNTAAIKNLSHSIGWPKYAIWDRAKELGICAARHDKPWTSDEDDVLEKYSHLMPRQIQGKLLRKGFIRSAMAIKRRLDRTKLRHASEFVSSNRLSSHLGVDHEKVTKWARQGFIKIARRADNRYYFSRDEIRKFIWRYPEMVELGRIKEPIWFIDILTRGEVAKQFGGGQRKSDDRN